MSNIRNNPEIDSEAFNQRLTTALFKVWSVRPQTDWGNVPSDRLLTLAKVRFNGGGTDE